MLEEFIAYLELHEISLLQDADKFQDIFNTYEGDFDSDEYRQLEIEDIMNTGEISATRHLLSVARDILAKTNERK
jgi:hypothetical protein